MTERKMYLRLFHGRDSKEQKLEDWGKDGPVFGPLQYVHTVYADNIDIEFEHDRQNRMFDFNVDEGLICYDGVFYGDWSVFMSTPKEAARLANPHGITGTRTFKGRSS